jgi:diaminopimelate epimerase
MRFTKLHGCGNDYLVIEDSDCQNRDLSELARSICDRHFGAGSDGIAIVKRHDSPSDYGVRIFNPDGSEAEVSGNGTRCVAGYLYYSKQQSEPISRLHTLSGVKIFRLIKNDGLTYVFETDMGAPRLKPSEIPISVDAVDSVIGHSLQVGEKTFQITSLSMGNPHCTVFVEGFDQIDIEATGKTLESHPAFPNRTNVEFVRIIDRSNIEARFYERGAGITLSSGSSSCASVVASILNGFTDRRVHVHTLAGILVVDWQDDGSVLLTGPAEVVYDGNWPK